MRKAQHSKRQTKYYLLQIAEARVKCRSSHSFTWAERNSTNEPRSIYQYSTIFCLTIPKGDLETKKTTPNIDVCPESLVAMSGYWYIKRSLLRSCGSEVNHLTINLKNLVCTSWLCGSSPLRSCFLSFSRRRSNKHANEHTWGEQKIGEKFGGDEREGGGVGRKGNDCSQSQIFYQTPFAHERRTIVQFDWLLARQSKCDITILSFMYISTSGAQQDQNRYEWWNRELTLKCKFFKC